MYTIPSINLLDFRYDLPSHFIPDRPLPERDLSKLLLYKKNEIGQGLFRNLPHHLPANSLLVFNNSRVIPARLLFSTANGATIEILCLQAVNKELWLDGTTAQTWKCVVGNLKRWKQAVLSIETEKFKLSAELVYRGGEENEVTFSWTGDFSFLEVLEQLGRIPLPPYMNRSADDSDVIRYQTVYASSPGSVAAPTAGLHFTDQVLTNLEKHGHSLAQVTLHVGAGTFKPIKSESVAEHKMHQEYFEVDKELVEKLLEAEDIIPVGTTSMRTLESLFHLGNRLLTGDESMHVHQWDGFETTVSTKNECLHAILHWMQKNNKIKLVAETSIMIVPGYKFQICKGLITNFHQPESTLILLVAALVGQKWRDIYEYAIENNFRFLSYGDSSLLLP